MKLTQAIYLVLAIVGFGAVLAIPMGLYSLGSGALPFWRVAASPGPLSKAHAFLEAECSACHNPEQGHHSRRLHDLPYE